MTIAGGEGPAGAVVIAAFSGEAEPLAAAAGFHAGILPDIERVLGEGTPVVTIRFDYAEEKPHRWRKEAVAALARKYAPARVNGVAPGSPDGDECHVRETIAFVAGNGGVTGQLLIAG